MIKKVLFDLDGTLIDSAHDLVQSANDLYALHNHPLITFEEGREVASDGIKAYLNLRFDEEVDDYSTLTNEFIKIYKSNILNNPILFDGIHDLINLLDRKKIGWGIITNNTDEKFDVITCLEMLEHVPDPNSIINTCSKLLKPGGKIFFSTINKNLKAFLFAIIGAEYILNLLPKGTHEYKKFIKPSQLQTWASRNDLSFDSIIGMTYNPITQKYKLSQDTSVNYIVQASLVND